MSTLAEANGTVVRQPALAQLGNGLEARVVAMIGTQRTIICPLRASRAATNDGNEIVRVRVPKTAMAFGGWKGHLRIDGSVLRIVGNDSAQQFNIDLAAVKRHSFNSNNGLWAFRMNDGRKLYLQTSGLFLSADRSGAGWDTTRTIAEILAQHGKRGFEV